MHLSSLICEVGVDEAMPDHGVSGGMDSIQAAIVFTHGQGLKLISVLDIDIKIKNDHYD